jgi:hypothetical protein
MSTNLQSKRAVLPQPEANLDLKPNEVSDVQSKKSVVTAPQSEAGDQKEVV